MARAALMQTRTDACAEQVWNEQQLAEPVLVPAWRIWTYREPAIVLGCSQRRLLAAARDDTNIALLLRGSGGGAVLAGPWMLGLSVALPAQHTLATTGLVASYRWLGELFAALLQEAGVAARALPVDAVRSITPTPQLAWACFGGLSPWEVVAGHRKIAGLAQVRRRHGVLLVGGLLLDTPNWPLLCRPLGHGAQTEAALTRVTTSWAQERGARPATRLVAAAIEARLQAVLPALQQPSPPALPAQSTTTPTASPPSRVFAAA
jgi:lipoate---protein ligase